MNDTREIEINQTSEFRGNLFDFFSYDDTVSLDELFKKFRESTASLSKQQICGFVQVLMKKGIIAEPFDDNFILIKKYDK